MLSIVGPVLVAVLPVPAVVLAIAGGLLGRAAAVEQHDRDDHRRDDHRQQHRAAEARARRERAALTPAGLALAAPGTRRRGCGHARGSPDALRARGLPAAGGRGVPARAAAGISRQLLAPASGASCAAISAAHARAGSEPLR